MALEMNTIGVKLKYVVESTAGTRPTTNYTALPAIKEIGELNLQPSKLDVTDLEDEVKRYIPGVKDTGGDFTLTANLTSAFKTAWETLVTAAETAFSGGKSVWFEILVPKLSASFYFAGMPIDLGINQQSVDAVEEITCHIIPNKIVGWDDSSTTSP